MFCNFFYYKFFLSYIKMSENTDLTYFQKKTRHDTKQSKILL